VVAGKATRPTSAATEREPREADTLWGCIASEAKSNQAKNQSETALAAAYRAAQERVARR
jgi:hypothetical protein